MRWASISSVSAVVLCVLVAAGCGSSSSGVDKANATMDCLLRAEHAAGARTIDALYADGKLGSQAQLEKRFAGIAPATYLDASGKLRPYAQLGGKALSRFDDWRLALEHTDRWGTTIQAAETKASNAASKRCGRT